MRNYLKLSNLSEVITRIIPGINVNKERKLSKEMPFVVLNSDSDYGFYMQRLVKQLNKFGLEEQPKILRKRSLKNIESGDLIVFGDVLGSNDFDYRVETNPRNLDNLDGRKFKAYDLIADWSKIMKRLEKYASENYSDEDEYILVEEKKNKKVPAHAKSYINFLYDAGVLNTEHLSYEVPSFHLHNAVSEQKVTIFNNWVKIGYNQYTIFCNLLGQEFIYVKGNKLYIKKDRLGRKYLVL
jgi:hypothetical protein